MSNSHSCFEEMDFKPPRCFLCNNIESLPDCKYCSNIIIRNANNIKKCSVCVSHAINIDAEIFLQKIITDSLNRSTTDSNVNEVGHSGNEIGSPELLEIVNGTIEVEIGENRRNEAIEETKEIHNISISSSNNALSIDSNKEASFPSFNKE